MEQIEAKKQLSNQPSEINAAVAQAPEINVGAAIPVQLEKNSCPVAFGIKSTAPSYIYAVGRINARFPTMALEKEFAQATGRTGKEIAGLTDPRAFHTVVKKRENRYLVRQLCWVLSIESIDTYILQPRDPADFDLLVETIRPSPSPMDIDVVIGVWGPIAPPEMCNGLMVPIVGFDQIYSFGRSKLMEALKEKRPENISEEEFTAAAEELLDRIMQMSDNAGATDEHRALNYLSVRYDMIYAKTAEMHQRNFSLTAVEVRPSSLSGVRKIIEVIFSYTQRETDFTEKFFVRVDVTEEFPFLVTKMSPCYDR